MSRTIIAVLVTLFTLTARAQTLTVDGEYTYYADPNVSPKEAKAAAIDFARAKVLADRFGTLVTQDILQQESEANGRSNSRIMMLSSAEVKGEWLEDIQEPVTKFVETMDDGTMVISVKVKGRARAINNNAVNFETLVLRNGTDKRFASTEFLEGDKMYLYFRAPANGYMAAYLVDEAQKAMRLLPHENDNDGQQKIAHDKEYVFFSEKHDANFSYEDGVRMTCDDDIFEMNTIYVLFSTNPFVKAIDDGRRSLDHDNLFLPPQLSLKKFTQWKSKICANDKKMGCRVMRIRVKKAQD